MIIYEGPSLLDGSPIVAIATFGSRNTKTGGMVQTWILRSDIAPLTAAKQGLDYSICGDCMHRSSNLGTCYVLLHQAPARIFSSYQRGYYGEFDEALFFRRRVRFGSYGDPAVVPMSAWRPILEMCNRRESTGYTHQIAHPSFDHQIAEFCQISVESAEAATAAHIAGYKTYRVSNELDLLSGEVECLSDSMGIQCIDCGLCNGQRKSIAIRPHGQRANKLIEAIAI